MNSAHKATNKEYRENWDRIFKKKCECGKGCKCKGEKQRAGHVS